VLGGTGTDAVNVGIGTTNPVDILTITGISNSPAVINLSQTGTTQYIGTKLQRTATEKWFVGMNNSDDDFIIRNNAATDVVTVQTSTGNVGVGSTNPTQAKLVVSGYQNGISFGYGFLNSGGNTGTASGAPQLSIYASDRIAATEYEAYSDARIKNIIGVSDNEKDLNTLAQIKITDYKFIDTIGKGTGLNKKVIAQQVEQVYPQAVDKITDVVPDIYRIAEIKAGRIDVQNQLNAGDKVKLVFADRQELMEVLSADANGFTISSSEEGKVFVYGKQVSDFHTVDYEALTTLNISATQELLKMINELQQKNTTLENKSNVMENKMASVESDLETIKSMLQINASSKK